MAGAAEQGPWAAARAAHQPGPAALAGRYTGQRGPLFGLALRLALISVATLGIYRFWEKTRIRRYIWASTRPGGDPFEYTGTGVEKFTGFLLAVLILAVLLGLTQIALFFAGLSIFSPAGGVREAGQHLFLAQGSLLLLLPLFFFAQYRARRYKLARTRWRGIRFGLDPGAWGYMWRGCLTLALTAATLGLLWPLMTFTLERYRTDRTCYGDARFTQTGRWTMLIPSLKHLALGLAIAGLLPLIGFATETPILWLGLVIGPVWVLGGYVHYRVDTFRRLTAAKRLIAADGTRTPTRLASHISTRAVLGHLLKGGLAVVILGAVATALIGSAMAGLGLADLTEGAPSLTGIGPVQAAASLIGLLGLLAVYGTLTLVFITQPIIGHVVATAEAAHPEPLAAIGQGAPDHFADADGFASALDFGGPF